MSREDWACVVLILLGIVFFIVGANIYNSLIGWFGVFLFVGGFLALIGLYIYNSVIKRKVKEEPSSAEPQNP